MGLFFCLSLFCFLSLVLFPFILFLFFFPSFCCFFRPLFFPSVCSFFAALNPFSPLSSFSFSCFRRSAPCLDPRNFGLSAKHASNCATPLSQKFWRISCKCFNWSDAEQKNPLGSPSRLCPHASVGAINRICSWQLRKVTNVALGIGSALEITFQLFSENFVRCRVLFGRGRHTSCCSAHCKMIRTNREGSCNILWRLHATLRGRCSMWWNFFW